MGLLVSKQEEDKQRMREQFELQKQQMNSKLEANVKELIDERENLIAHNRSMEEAFKEMQDLIQVRSEELQNVNKAIEALQNSSPVQVIIERHRGISCCIS